MSVNKTDGSKKIVDANEDIACLHKEIDLIQSCISRMAHNSFLIKGWTITVVVIAWAIIGLDDWGSWFILLLLLPLTMFWGLDSFYLMTEKRYRKLYSWALKKRIEEKSLEMRYDLNPLRFKDECGTIWKVIFSKTMWPFYGILGITIICVVILRHFVL